MNLNNLLFRSNVFLLEVAQNLYLTVKNFVIKGGNIPMTEKEEKELNEMLDRIEKQHETLRKAKGEEAPYKHLAKQDKVTVYTNDKKAMKFWEE